MPWHGFALPTRELYLIVSGLTEHLPPLAKFADPRGDVGEPSVFIVARKLCLHQGFLDKSENAMSTKIWCAVATYPLLITMSRCY